MLTFEEKKKILEKAADRFDYIIEHRDGPDFLEVVGCIGGDVLTYRYYVNGIVTER